MDRERIERRDFPTGRRGYDPAAVDEHLRRLADEFESREHPPPPAPVPTLADSTSEQVRLILDAAQRGADELRATAGAEASDHVTRVQTAADGMLTKLDALESELNRLMTALRESGERLSEGLAELQAEAGGAAAPAPRVTPAEFERIDSRDLPANAVPAPTPPVADEREASARLVALNMALGGSPREDARVYLTEHFSLSDVEALLDDVYAKVDR